MIETIKFTVFGEPIPQGSMKGFVIPGKNGKKPRAVLTSDNKRLKPFRQELTRAAMAEMTRLRLDTFDPPAGKHVPVRLEVDFYLAKPPSVSQKRTMPSVKPDLSKLVRATEDSLTGVLWADDAQVVECLARKFYGSPARVEITMRMAATEGPGLPCEVLFSENQGEAVKEQAHGY